ncbi:hypothetical protein GYMLUDRAFT_249940 [Collybiopsis luxurians FD-317 M1]|uniref:Unplaced genomic scaffold GYMLUscaffold_74, whole genome shotgun sequence n=1 Tax=Collybiopsis luxurians FD-317 M1 TaxID=944289 RepID=A0A0D0BW63_9AGAR|nr:hypothetical protein GYMLUDRAFT_249940 [Collybiopsis luxurians FD-317 M1]
MSNIFPVLTNVTVAQLENLPALCSFVLSPFGYSSDEKSSSIEEIPGNAYYSGLNAQVSPASPSEFTHSRPGHLHFELDSLMIPRPEIASKMDVLLRSYLDLSNTEDPLHWITSNQPELVIYKLWPLTVSTGKLRERQGNLWWASRWW